MGGRCGPEVDLVERIPALDAVNDDARWARSSTVRHVTGGPAARIAAAGAGSWVTRPVRHGRLPPTERIRRLRGVPDRHNVPPIPTDRNRNVLG